MDRFIGFFNILCKQYDIHLKSNMDRFIAVECESRASSIHYLKSNMDRFIVVQLDGYTTVPYI